VHAAQSWFHDIVPARREGIPCVWVNRKEEPLAGDARPTGVVRNLAGLASWLEA
jgi:FMN phosphatase YigB (HAD superfamily)